MINKDLTTELGLVQRSRNHIKIRKMWGSKNGLIIKVLAAEPKHQSSIPRTHIVDLLQVVLWHPRVHRGVNIHVTHTNK